MASGLEGDLRCSVCHDVFKDPVVLSCSHSFCRDCLNNRWEEKPTLECPVCDRRSSKAEPPSNLVLKNLCESVLKEWALQETLKPLKEKLKRFEKAKVEFHQTAKHIKVQARHTEGQIKDRFQKLHQFLSSEEHAALAALSEEEERKSHVMKKKMEALSMEIAALSDMVKAMEQQLRAGDASVQTHQLSEDPQLPSGVLIDQARHLGNLTLTIWSKMVGMVRFTPLSLDPNSAHSLLTLSEDLTTVAYGAKYQQLPDNPERIHSYCSVLGSEGFNSGARIWDVFVGDNADWALGVLAESVKRKGKLESGKWRIWYYDGKYYAQSRWNRYTVLPRVKKLQRVRVSLDWSGGKLSFSDADTNAFIHSFTHTFTERMFPYFSTMDKRPLKILPLDLCMTGKQSTPTGRWGWFGW